jgi:prepilin-type N-terminal cleavage/methylation domain-containing protein
MRVASRAFTLIELLVVMAIIVIIMGLVFASPRSDAREEAVRGASEELAAVMRETRARALRGNVAYGLVFHIQNEPGSSGWVLNNRSGGHWYRVIGPYTRCLEENTEAVMGVNQLPFILQEFSMLNGRDTGTDGSLDALLPLLKRQKDAQPMQHYLAAVASSWVEEPQVLPRGKVRFLALSDQDNGDNAAPDRGGRYSATYPRPWFGWWEEANQQFHPWGGYEPGLEGEVQGHFNATKRSLGVKTQIAGRIASPSGFYYEGWDGEIRGCRNPVDRRVLKDRADGVGVTATSTDKNYAGIYDSYDYTGNQAFTVYAAGTPRPLINADWMDYVIRFKADGSVDDDWFRARQHYSQASQRADDKSPFIPTDATHLQGDPWGGAQLSLNNTGILDRCNGTAGQRNFDDYTTAYPQASNAQREATSWVGRTGYYWITLAPDAVDDSSTFPSAQAALRSITPAYRVGISPDGHVKVIRVRTTKPANRSYDLWLTGTGWQDESKVWGKAGATWNWSTAITTKNYVNHELRDESGAPYGEPIHDTVTTEMLRDRKMWWAP